MTSSILSMLLKSVVFRKTMATKHTDIMMDAKVELRHSTNSRKSLATRKMYTTCDTILPPSNMKPSTRLLNGFCQVDWFDGQMSKNANLLRIVRKTFIFRVKKCPTCSWFVRMTSNRKCGLIYLYKCESFLAFIFLIESYQNILFIQIIKFLDNYLAWTNLVKGRFSIFSIENRPYSIYLCLFFLWIQVAFQV